MTQTFKVEYKSFFQHLVRAKVHPERNVISLSSPFDSLNYTIVGSGRHLMSETMHFFQPCFKCLAFEDFFFVWSCLMLEKTVVFVSEKLQRISSAM